MPREDGIVSRPGAPGAERVYLTLVAEHQTAILNYLYRLVGDADAAEDLTQETYVKAWRALERLELDEDAEARRRAWLYRIAHNAALDHLRRKTRFRWLGLDALRGGSGETGDWQLAAGLAGQYRVLLAGGLTPGNVADAIRQVAPWGVDVASGVEAAPGRKDHDLVREFVRTVISSQ